MITPPPQPMYPCPLGRPSPWDMAVVQQHIPQMPYPQPQPFASQSSPEIPLVNQIPVHVSVPDTTRSTWSTLSGPLAEGTFRDVVPPHPPIPMQQSQQVLRGQRVKLQLTQLVCHSILNQQEQPINRKVGAFINMYRKICVNLEFAIH